MLGHHWSFGTLGDGWAAIQQSNQGTVDVEGLTAVASHEFAEAATDTGNGYKLVTAPDPCNGNVWAAWEGLDPTGFGYIENGDFCEGTRILEGQVTYQRIYGNKEAAVGDDPCVPALNVPYFNVTTPAAWVEGVAGGTVSIPVTGWSTAATDDFWVAPAEAAWNPPSLTFKWNLVSPRTGKLLGVETAILNNDESCHLDVALPACAISGSWVILSLWNWHADADNISPPGEDSSHLYAVGIHVP